MDVLPLFGINVAIFSIFPFYFTTYKNPLRSVSLYIYLSIILTVGGFLGAVYSFPITDSITVSGGNLAYGAFMMSTILLVIVERNLGAVQNVIRLVITVNVVKVLLFSVVSWALDHNDVLNPFSTSSAVFDASLWVVFLGGALIISELLLLLLIFERLKTHLTNVFWLSILYIIFFIVALCLDGVLFPTIFFGFTPELTEIVVGNVKGKFVMALAFSLPMLIFLFTFRKKLTQFVEAPLVLRDLLSMPKEKLVEEIERQRKFLEMNQDQLRRVAQRLSLSTEAAGIGIWDWDLITNMLIWDERMYELYGVRPGMFDDTYQAWEQRLHPAELI